MHYYILKYKHWNIISGNATWIIQCWIYTAKDYINYNMAQLLELQYVCVLDYGASNPSSYQQVEKCGNWL